jgi:TRAP-type C4-dicarboxylate transport system substrate-binding protein
MRFRPVYAFLALLFAHSASAVEIKLGTLAPSGSPWHNLLKEMAQKWKEASGGQVDLRIYPGGVLGNEGDMVRKMRVGQIQAAAVTTIGLHDITPEPQAVDTPLVIGSYDELDYVMAKVEPKLDAALEAKGYVALQWADVGFVRFFSAKPIATVADMKGAKLFAWDGDPKSVEAWRAAGFQPVVLSSTDVIPSLQTGLIDTIAAAPLYAFTSRIFQKAKNMNDLGWGILTGATVVRKEAWDQVPAAVKPKLLEIAHDYGKRINGLVRKMNDDALVQMKAQGLAVVPAKDPPGWQRAADQANKIVRGGVVPADLYDEVVKLRDEYRKQPHPGDKR